MIEQLLSIERDQLKDPKLRAAHVKQFEESGLSLTAYCKLTGIHTSTFAGWKKRYGESKGYSAPSKFVEVTAHQGASLPYGKPHDLMVKIHLRDGRVVEIGGHLEIQEIVTLIKELS